MVSSEASQRWSQRWQSWNILPQLLHFTQSTTFLPNFEITTRLQWALKILTNKMLRSSALHNLISISSLQPYALRVTMCLTNIVETGPIRSDGLLVQTDSNCIEPTYWWDRRLSVYLCFKPGPSYGFSWGCNAIYLNWNIVNVLWFFGFLPLLSILWNSNACASASSGH